MYPIARYIEVLIPVPVNVALSGNRVVANVIKMRSFWSRVNPSFSVTGVLTRREEVHSQR